MSDPDDPSSSGFTKQPGIPPEWDKEALNVGGSSPDSSRSPSKDAAQNDGNTELVAHEKERPGRRERLRRKLARSKRNRHHDAASNHVDASGQPGDMSEKTASNAGTANTAASSSDSATLDSNENDEFQKHNFFVRFCLIVKEIVFSSYVNYLLIFVPVGIIVHAIGLRPEIIFAMNALAIIPLASLLAYATEVVALSLGDTLGALLNVSFGNAVELIIFIIALVKNEINIVQASLIGSILSNLLLILGMAFLFGGLRFQEQLYNSTVTQMSACLLSLAVTSLLLPTAFHASFTDSSFADSAVLKLSRGTSVILLLVYILYLLFQLKSHAYMYASTPQHIIDEESRPGVLTEFLNTSSSSDDDSDDSSSSSSDSDESHRTAKIIKRALKGRRRRKSNNSTVGSPSLKSKMSRQSLSTSNGNMERPIILTPPNGSHSPTNEDSNAVISGDEADTDGEGEQHGSKPRTKSFEPGQVQHRDFGQTLAAPEELFKGDRSHRSITFEADEPKPSRKLSRKEKKAEKRAAEEAEKEAKKEEKRERRRQKKAIEEEKAEAPTRRTVDFVTVEEIKPAPLPQAQLMVRYASSPGENVRRDSTFADGAETPGRRMSNPGRRPLDLLPIRPQLPKMLSQTVFSRGYNAQVLTKPAPDAAPRAPYGLRRTSSLPERLNRANSIVGRKSLTGVAAAGAGTDGDANQIEVVEKVELKHRLSRFGAVLLLLISTALVAVCAEFLVDSISGLVAESSVTEAFIGLIILPIVGNAAEHVTAVTVAAKNKMDLGIGIAVGSSIQIAIFVTPIVVLLGWILDKDMSLYFTLFETVSLFASAFIVNFLVLDGRSNYLEGALLIAAYTIIAVAAFFYPDCDPSSNAQCGTSISGMGGH